MMKGAIVCLVVAAMLATGASAAPQKVILAPAPPVHASGVVEYIDTAADGFVLDAEQMRLFMETIDLPGIKEMRLAKIDTAVFLEEARRPIDVALFGAVDHVTLVRSKINVRGEADYSWFADGVDGHDGTHAIVVVRDDHVYATVRAAGRLYSIKSLSGGVQAVIEFDEAAFPPEMDPLDTTFTGYAAAVKDAAAQQGRQDISVIIAFTPAGAGQVANIYAHIQLAMDETNQGYERSEINLVVHDTRVYQTNYTESASFSTDLSRFRTKNDGYMDEVHGYRNEDRANMAHLITRSGSYCGVASTIMASTSSAFCLTAQNCATGYYTFAHEMGHLQGARHDPATDPSQSPFPYGHGYIISSRQYRTVMAYNQAGETRVNQWSNPSVSYQGHVTGSASCCDNARVLDETASTVAGWCANGAC